jgi:hypothetical protein
MTTKFKPLLILVSGIFFMQSCGDDDKSPAADVLVTSNRQTGAFYKIDQKTGDTTKIFTPTVTGSTLTDVRAFVYHKGEDMFFASANSEAYSAGSGSKINSTAGISLRLGFLYKMNPKTKVASVINNNDGNGGEYDVWDAINNWAVAEDDSLVAIGDFNDDGNGIVKFGTDGGRSLKTKEVDICCGNGLLYDAKTDILTVSSSWDTDDGEIDIVAIVDGEITTTTTITTFTGFPETESITNYWLTMKAMAINSKGTIFGILYNRDEGRTYLVTVDMEGEEIKLLKKLGDDSDHQFNTLAFIPAKYAK